MNTIIILISLITTITAYVYIAGCMHRRMRQRKIAAGYSCSQRPHPDAMFWLPIAIGRAIRIALTAIFRLGAREPKAKLPRAKAQK